MIIKIAICYFTLVLDTEYYHLLWCCRISLATLLCVVACVWSCLCWKIALLPGGGGLQHVLMGMKFCWHGCNWRCCCGVVRCVWSCLWWKILFVMRTRYWTGAFYVPTYQVLRENYNESLQQILTSGHLNWRQVLMELGLCSPELKLFSCPFRPL